MRAIAFACALLLCGCARPDPAAGYEISSLPIDEANAARDALQRADNLITTDETPNREYGGYAGINVIFGENGQDVVVSLFGTRFDRRDSAIFNFAPPREQALLLATTGWDFTLTFDPPNNPVFQTDAGIRGRVSELQLQADPDGLFFATLHLVDLDGVPHTVTATGRLTGICTLATGGMPTTPDDIARCNEVIGELSPPTEREPRAPSR